MTAQTTIARAALDALFARNTMSEVKLVAGHYALRLATGQDLGTMKKDRGMWVVTLATGAVLPIAYRNLSRAKQAICEGVKADIEGFAVALGVMPTTTPEEPTLTDTTITTSGEAASELIRQAEETAAPAFAAQLMALELIKRNEGHADLLAALDTAAVVFHHYGIDPNAPLNPEPVAAPVQTVNETGLTDATIDALLAEEAIPYAEVSASIEAHFAAQEAAEGVRARMTLSEGVNYLATAVQHHAPVQHQEELQHASQATSPLDTIPNLRELAAWAETYICTTTGEVLGVPDSIRTALAAETVQQQEEMQQLSRLTVDPALPHTFGDPPALDPAWVARCMEPTHADLERRWANEPFDDDVEQEDDLCYRCGATLPAGGASYSDLGHAYCPSCWKVPATPNTYTTPDDGDWIPAPVLTEATMPEHLIPYDRIEDDAPCRDWYPGETDEPEDIIDSLTPADFPLDQLHYPGLTFTETGEGMMPNIFTNPMPTGRTIRWHQSFSPPSDQDYENDRELDEALMASLTGGEA